MTATIPSTPIGSTRLDLTKEIADKVKWAGFSRRHYTPVRGTQGRVLFVRDAYLGEFQAFIDAVSAPPLHTVVATEINAQGNVVQTWSNGDRTELIHESKFAWGN